jgi:hypothetical protein
LDDRERLNRKGKDEALIKWISAQMPKKTAVAPARGIEPPTC